jgi:hypothetical protein
MKSPQPAFDCGERKVRLPRAPSCLQPVKRDFVLAQCRIDYSYLNRTIADCGVHSLQLSHYLSGAGGLPGDAEQIAVGRERAAVGRIRPQHKTLWSLRESGVVGPEHAAYKRGVKYLLDTQWNDGSWYVRSRSPKFQPYFQSGFPYDHDQWISATATAWAAMALSRDR